MNAFETYLATPDLATPASVPAPEIAPDAVIYYHPLSMKTTLVIEGLKKKGESEPAIARAAFPSVVCTADGKPIFPGPPTDAQWAAIDRLPVNVIARVMRAATAAAEGEVEDAKN